MTLRIITPPTVEPPNVSGVYAIRCTPTGKVYVGSAVWIAKRWRHHREALRKGEHHSSYLQHAWRKHGEQAFEFCVLSVVPKERLISEEQRFIDEMMACDEAHGFNLNPRAGSNLGRKFGPEACARISAGKRAAKLKLSPEHRAAISERLKGNSHALGSKHSEETRAKYRSMRLGKHPGLGRVISPEHRRQISATLKGVPKSAEHIEKARAARWGNK